MLITTKSGAEGKAKVQLSANLSISNPVNVLMCSMLVITLCTVMNVSRMVSCMTVTLRQTANWNILGGILGSGESSGSYYRRNGCSRSGV